MFRMAKISPSESIIARVDFSRFYNLHPWYWNFLVYSFLSSVENLAFVHFAAAVANHNNLAFLFHQVPITAGWTEVA